MRRPSMTQALCVTTVLAVCLSGTATAVGASKPKPKPKAPHLAGTWSGKYSGAVSGTFTLKWKETKSRLSGTIVLSRPSGSYGITGSVSGKTIHFGAVNVGATYKGSVSGSSMSGTWMSPQGGGSWSAHRIRS